MTKTHSFSRKALRRSSQSKFFTFSQCTLELCTMNAKPIRRSDLFPSSLRVDSYGRDGILTVCPSPAPFGMSLGPPNPWLIASATETLDFRGSNFSLGLWLLMPTFSLPTAPVALAGRPSVLMGMLSYHSLTSLKGRTSMSFAKICTRERRIRDHAKPRIPGWTYSSWSCTVLRLRSLLRLSRIF